MSAEEDPLEAPMFEFPLKDTVVTAGTEVLLRVIIAGTPFPEGKLSQSLCSTYTECTNH